MSGKICPLEGNGSAGEKLGCVLHGLSVLGLCDDDATGVDIPVGKAAEAFRWVDHRANLDVVHNLVDGVGISRIGMINAGVSLTKTR